MAVVSASEGDDLTAPLTLTDKDHCLFLEEACGSAPAFSDNRLVALEVLQAYHQAWAPSAEVEDMVSDPENLAPDLAEAALSRSSRSCMAAGVQRHWVYHTTVPSASADTDAWACCSEKSYSDCDLASSAVAAHSPLSAIYQAEDCLQRYWRKPHPVEDAVVEELHGSEDAEHSIDLAD